MPRLPPVPISPHARLLARLRPGVMPSVATLVQSQSSSSATSWASPVRVPCPISARAMRITQVSSGLITTQRLSSASPGSTLAVPWAPAKGTCIPSASPPPAAAEATRKRRRETFGMLSRAVMVASSRLRRMQLGGTVDGGPDALVCPAPADVGHGRIDVGIARARIGGEQRRGGHDLARLAIAALRHVELGPGALD